MKSTVLISYYFPPDGTAGVYRPLRFIRCLPQMGWQSTAVIALDGSHFARYDPKLLDSVPRETQIIRVRSRDVWQAFQMRRALRYDKKLSALSADEVAEVRVAHRRPLRSILRRMVRRIEGWCYYPDMARGWIRAATEATIQHCERKRSDVILATGGPWSSFVVAQRASQHTGVPYVLDFRDSWTLTHNQDFDPWRPAWAMRLDRRLLHSLFADARAVIFRYNSEAESYWRAYSGVLKSSRIYIVPNGYDGQIERFRAAGGDRCTILYTGTVKPYRYDTLLEALCLLRKSVPDRARQVHLLFVGEGTQTLAEEATSKDLSDIVETLGPIPYAEVAQLQRDAHALLLLGLKPFQGYELCGSKVFGYLKAGRPIFGVLPQDEMKKVLCGVNGPTIADIDSPAEIVAVLKQVLDAWSQGTLSSLLPDRAACEIYSAERQITTLLSALEGLPPERPFIPGSIDIPQSLQEKIGTGGWVDGGTWTECPESQ